MGETVKVNWRQDDFRSNLVKTELKRRIKEMRSAANKLRNAYAKEFMGDPVSWVADAIDEAASVLKARLDELSK
jgi:hypothetical protein